MTDKLRKAGVVVLGQTIGIAVVTAIMLAAELTTATIVGCFIVSIGITIGRVMEIMWPTN